MYIRCQNTQKTRGKKEKKNSKKKRLESASPVNMLIAPSQ
jgi:hypothetical protein